MGSTKRTLEVVIAGDASGAQRAFGDLGSSADGLGGKFGGLGTAAAAGFAAVGAAAVGAGAALFSIGSQFDGAYDQIVVTTGATGDRLAGLQDSFRNVVANVPTDMDSAGAAIAGLNQRLGLTGQPLEDMAGQVLELSRLTGTDLNSNVQNVTRLFGDWGVEAGDQAGRLDELFRASQLTGAGVDQLSQNLVTFGAPLRQLGFGFQESTALLANFEKSGVNAELVMGSMRTSLGRMARDGEPAQATFERVTQSIKDAGSVSEANAIALELFGARAGPDMAAALREGRFEVDNLAGAIANGESTIAGTSAATADWSEKWTLFKNQVLLKLEPIATRVFDAIGDGAERLGPLFDRLVAFGTELRDVFDQGGLGAVAERLGQAFSDAWPTIRAKLSELLGALGDWVVDMAPVVGAQLAEWGGALVEWILPQIPPLLRQLGSLLASVGQWALDEGLPLLVATMRDWGTALVDWAAPQLGPLLSELWTMTLELGSWLLTDALPVIVEKLAEWGAAFAAWVWDPGIPMLLEGLGAMLGELGAWITDSALPAIISWTADMGGALLGWIGDAAAAAPGMLWDVAWAVQFWAMDLIAVQIPQALIGAGAALLGWVGEAALAAPGALAAVWDAISTWFTNLPGQISTAAVGMFDGIVDALRAAVNSLIDLWNGLSFTIGGGTYDPAGAFGPSITVPEFTLDTPNIDRLHTGGLVTAPGESLVAVRQGERVVTPGGQGAGGRSAGAGQQVAITNHFHIARMDEREVAQAVENQQRLQLSMLAGGLEGG